MKSLLIAVTAALMGSTLSFALVGHAQSARTPASIAFVSASHVLTDTAAGRSEASRLQTMQQQRARDLMAKQQALIATRQELASSSDATARIALQQKETQQRTELEQATQQAQIEYQNLQRQINVALQQQLKAVLDDLMKTQNYQLVLNSDTALLWSVPDLDLTPAVVAKMNAQP
jgi:Skp family chaperone for outer membrane proteins